MGDEIKQNFVFYVQEVQWILIAIWHGREVAAGRVHRLMENLEKNRITNMLKSRLNMIKSIKKLLENVCKYFYTAFSRQAHQPIQ